MFRALRRLIIRKFGGVKRFLLLLAFLGVTVYCIYGLHLLSYTKVWHVKDTILNYTFDDGCGVKCCADQLSFYIRTGKETEVGPTICFHGSTLVNNELKNFGRGLNVISVDSVSQRVSQVQNFDTYLSDAGLLRFLKMEVPDKSLLLVASFDEASLMLRKDCRKWLQVYGSSVIDMLSFRDGFIMIGQKGLKQGHAIEYISKKKSDIFAPVIEKAGCLSLPLGPVNDVVISSPGTVHGKPIDIGQHMPFCGLPSACQTGSVAVGLFTGAENVKPPLICVNGSVVLSDKVNSGGRGFNVIVLDSGSMHPVSVIHADTFSTDSTNLEVFLQSIQKTDIVIAVVSDEGATKLGYSARDLFNSFGSGFIQNLHFRDIWIFIGQKGMNGFTTMEQISYVPFNGGWPKPLNQSFCVPARLVGRKIIPDPEVHRFYARRKFCTQHDGYQEFCDPSHVDDKLVTVGIANKSYLHHPIFDVPLLLIPGIDHNGFVRTLQTTLMQPGIKLTSVMVMWDEAMPEYAKLADLFGFRNVSLPSAAVYSDLMGHAIRRSLLLFPKAMHFIVLEENVLLAPDFITFLAQCLQPLSADPSLLAVSSWNVNGFEQTSGNRELLYRVEEFPGVGFLAKRATLDKLVATLPHCCRQRSMHGWHIEFGDRAEILVPDVSRVFVPPFSVYSGGSAIEHQFLTEVFLRPRTTSLEKPVLLQSPDKMVDTQYEELLQAVLQTAAVLQLEDIHDCVHSLQPPPDLSTVDSPSIAVFYEQKASDNFTLLNGICRCFGLVCPSGSKPKNMHRGLIRWWYSGHNLLLIESSSLYYKTKSAARITVQIGAH